MPILISIKNRILYKHPEKHLFIGNKSRTDQLFTFLLLNFFIFVKHYHLIYIESYKLNWHMPKLKKDKRRLNYGYWRCSLRCLKISTI
jgi:hypothetical protein